MCSSDLHNNASSLTTKQNKQHISAFKYIRALGLCPSPCHGHSAMSATAGHGQWQGYSKLDSRHSSCCLAGTADTATLLSRTMNEHGLSNYVDEGVRVCRPRLRINSLQRHTPTSIINYTVQKERSEMDGWNYVMENQMTIIFASASLSGSSALTSPAHQ